MSETKLFNNQIVVRFRVPKCFICVIDPIAAGILIFVIHPLLHSIEGSKFN